MSKAALLIRNFRTTFSQQPYCDRPFSPDVTSQVDAIFFPPEVSKIHTILTLHGPAIARLFTAATRRIPGGSQSDVPLLL